MKRLGSASERVWGGGEGMGRTAGAAGGSAGLPTFEPSRPEGGDASRAFLTLCVGTF